MSKKSKEFIFKGIFILFIYSFLELSLNIFFSYYQSYDIEMWKYARDLKEKSPYLKMSHRHRSNSKAFLYGAEIKTNSRGLRDREFDYKKPANTFRTLFLGDSLTLGWGVDYKNLFTKLLEKDLKDIIRKPVEVINTGVGNYNTEQEYTYLKNEGYKYNPQHIMLLYFINDAEPTPEYSDTPILDKSITMVFIWSRIKKILAKFDSNNSFLDYYSNLYSDGNKGWENSKKSLLAIKKEAQRLNSKLTIAICPELRFFLKEYPFMSAHQKILSFLKESKIDFIDLLPVFRSMTKDEQNLWVSLEDSHPNALGNKIIAQGIQDHFLKHPNKL